MAEKYLWIALLVTVQISVALCRTTEQPLQEEKETSVDSIALAEIKLLKEHNYTDDFGNPISKEFAIHRGTSYDDYIDDSHHIAVQYDVVAIVGPIIGILCILSLILGCILLICKKPQPRRGYIVNPNTGGQTSGIENPGYMTQGTPGVVQPVQYNPPSFAQLQQKDIYPPINPTN